MRQRGLKADDVAELTCRIAQGAAPIVCLPWEAKQAASGHQMRWSLPAVVAAALHDGAITLDTFERDLADRRARSRASASSGNRWSRTTSLPASRPSCRRDWTTGARWTSASTMSTATPAVLPPLDDVLQKFRANAARTLDGPSARALEDALMNIDGDGFARLKPLLATKH